MSRQSRLAQLRGGVIVSVQAEADSLLNAPETIALLARCAMQNGASGVRIEGTARIEAVRAALPHAAIIGIIKQPHDGFEPYITATRAAVSAVIAAGADVVAFDATARPRPDGSSVAALIAETRQRGAIAMADCSDEADAVAASEAGADLVATTLAGYTPATHGRRLPDMELVRAIAARHPFAICEGGVASPDDVGRAFAAGAGAVVVGTAITNVDARVRTFCAAAPRARSGNKRESRM